MKSQSQLFATDLSRKSTVFLNRKVFANAFFAFLLLLLTVIPFASATSINGEAAGTTYTKGSSVSDGMLDETNHYQLEKSLPKKMPPFLSIRKLADGETDIRIHYRGITAKETSAMLATAAATATTKTGTTVAKKSGKLSSTVGMRLLQITDGRHFVQAVYDAGYTALKDCEYVRDADEVAAFLAEFEDDANAMRNFTLAAKNNGTSLSSAGSNPALATGLSTLRRPSKADVGVTYRRMLDYRTVRADCKTLHRRMKRAKVLRRQEEREKRDVAATTTTTADVDSRSKRELFIYPDTNWCGVGSTSEGFNDLGLNAAADRCCRQHDHCPYMIEGFTTKYNLFNYRFHTLSHCECDERFRTCLKMVDNSISNLVGKLFFNVVQMKCFVLKSEKTCVKRTWWGRCSKHEKQVTAHMKDVLAY